MTHGHVYHMGATPIKAENVLADDDFYASTDFRGIDVSDLQRLDIGRTWLNRHLIPVCRRSGNLRHDIATIAQVRF